MNWHAAMQNARKTLKSHTIPSSLDLISLIKGVNPTTVCLSDADRELGYELKTRLQNLLLEQYGEAFCLIPDPLDADIVLIRHTALPSIDACHTELAALSVRALDSVAAHDPAPAGKKCSRKARKVEGEKAAGEKVAGEIPPVGDSPPEVLDRAQRFLAAFDFAAAGDLLCGMRISGREELVFVERAARALLEEIGAYQQAIELLLGQQSQFQRDSGLRVLLARAYHLNGALPEARAIFDDLHWGELDKEALVAYADLAHKDGDLMLAQRLLKAAAETEGYAGNQESLQRELETALLAQAEPLLERALAALECADLAEAERWARQVLQICPNHQGAREIVIRIDSDRQAAAVAALWERLARAEQSEGRLELLEQLSGCDRDNRERITGLIAAEISRQKKESAQARLERLRALAKDAAWPEAFEVVWWLQDQEGQADACREACALSPYLSVLHENKRLSRLSERSARQVWLDLVQALGSLRSGHPAGCLKILEAVKQYFEKYQVFREAYQLALEAEREKARAKVKELLLAASRDDASLSQAQHCLGAARRAMLHLPPEERAQYCDTLEARIAELTPPEPEGELIEAYKYVTRSGNHAKAAIFRRHVSNQAALDQFDVELAQDFAIERCALNLACSDTLQVDLLSEQPLQWIGSTDRHLVLREADDAIVIVHLEKMQATRFASPHFKNLQIADVIPPDDTFLFRDAENPLLSWRAELSDEKSAFTACFEVTDFCEQENDVPVAVFLSSERATDYYAVILDADSVRPGRVVRKRLGNRSPVSDSIKVENKIQLEMRRMSWHPDKFIIGGEEEMKVCTRNLTSDYRVQISPRDIWGIDLVNNHLYHFDRALLKRSNLAFEQIERLTNSSCCYFFHEFHKILSLCPTTNTLMVGFGQMAALYDFIGNRISSPFSWGRLIGTKPARKWYSYDYCKETRALTLRDVTVDVATLLHWEDSASIPDPEDRSPDWLERLYNQIYFGHKFEDNPDVPPSSE